MNRIALGTVQFGMNYGIANVHGRISDMDAVDIIGFAKRSGMDTIDTAMAYGESETRLGAIGVAGWRVVTKLPAVPYDCGDVNQWVRSTVNASMSRIGIKKLHGLLLHQPGQLLETGGEKIHDALLELKNSGMVEKIGVSVYGPDELDALFDHYPIDIVQAPFNLLDRRMQQSGWLHRLSAAGVELHVRSIFLQGLLLMNPHERSRRFPEWIPQWTALQEWMKQVEIAPLEACVRHALSLPLIQRVVVGIDSLAHLHEIARAAENGGLEAPESLSVTDNALLNPALWGVR